VAGSCDRGYEPSKFYSRTEIYLLSVRLEKAYGAWVCSSIVHSLENGTKNTGSC